jgi:hypothetical protein
MIDRLTFCQLKYEQKVYFSPTAAQRLVRPTSPKRWSSEHGATPYTSSAKPRMPRRSSMPMILVPFSSPKTTNCSKASFDDSSFELEATSHWWEPGTPTSISTLSHSVSNISPASSSGRIKVGEGSRWRKLNHARRGSTGSARLEKPSIDDRHLKDEQNAKESSPTSSTASPSDSEPVVHRSRYARLASIGSSTTSQQGTEESKSEPVISISRYTRRASIGSSTTSQQRTEESKSDPVISISRNTRRASTGSSTPSQQGTQLGSRLDRLSSARLETPSIDDRHLEDEQNAKESFPRSSTTSPSESEPVVFRSRYARRASIGSSTTSRQGTEESKSEPVNCRSRDTRRASTGSSTPSQQGTHKSGGSPVSIYRLRHDKLSSNRSIRTDACEEEKMESTAPRKSRAARLNSLTGSSPRMERPKFDGHGSRRAAKLDTCEEEKEENTTSRKSRSARRRSNPGQERGSFAQRPTLLSQRSSRRRIRAEDSKEDEASFVSPQASTCRRRSLSGAGRSNERQGLIVPRFARRRSNGGRQDSARSIRAEDSKEDEAGFVSPQASTCRRRSLPGAGQSNERQGLIVPRGSDDKSRSAASNRSIEAVRKSLGCGVSSPSDKNTPQMCNKSTMSSRRSSAPSNMPSKIDGWEQLLEANRSIEAVRKSLGCGVSSPSDKNTSQMSNKSTMSSRRSSAPSNMPSNIDGWEQLLEADRPRLQPRRNSMFTGSTDKESTPPLPTSTKPKKLPPSLHVLLCKGSDDEKTFISNVTTESSLESSWSLAKARWTA